MWAGRTTETTTEPSGLTYGAPRATVALVEPEGLTTTVPAVKFRLHTEPTANGAPRGVPTSSRQYDADGSPLQPIE